MSGQFSASTVRPFQPGIDVSHFQGDIDWTRVKAAGVQFAFIKATDGLTGIDPKLSANMTGAANAGIPFGLYHFYRPGTSRDGERQAFHFLSSVLPRPKLPSVLDLELAPIILSDVEDWLTAVAAATGVQPIVYGSPSFLTEHCKDWAGTGTYPLWVAEYTTRRAPSTGPWKNWDFWQFSNTGSVDGISGPVDLDWFNGDLDALQSLIS
jgi:lysozyme